MFIDTNETDVNLNNLTQLQKQLMHDIRSTAQADGDGDDDPTPVQLLAASEKCAEQSYHARTPAGPSGELAAVYRAIGRALSRPVEVSDAPAEGWEAYDRQRHAVRQVGEYQLYADMDGDWQIRYGRGRLVAAEGRVPEQKNEEGTMRLAQKTAERELADKLRATLDILEG